MRKIIKAGNTSFAVILPRAWLRYYGLTNKDKVKVTSNSKIIIEPAKKMPSKLNPNSSGQPLETVLRKKTQS